MPGRYEKLGIEFQYPDNWRLDESDALEGQNSVSVYSPGGAFWSIILHPAESDRQTLVDAALEAMRQVYTELDAEPVHEVVAGYDLIGYDMNFYCLDLTNTALARAVESPEGVFLLHCQADDREFELVEPVFRAITISLLTAGL